MIFNILDGEAITIDRQGDTVSVVYYRGDSDATSCVLPADKQDMPSFEAAVNKLRKDLDTQKASQSRPSSDNTGSSLRLDG